MLTIDHKTPRLDDGTTCECNVFEFEPVVEPTLFDDEIVTETVLKVFPQRYNAEIACDNQRHAAKFGLAPLVLLGVKPVKVNGYVEYGYVSERVEVLPDMDAGDRDDFLTDNKDEIDELQEQLAEIFGKQYGDLHSGNIGFKNGKMVCIDFGLVSMRI